MPVTTVIVERTTGALLIVNPPRDARGAVVLPESVDSAVVELSAVEAAKLSQSGSFTVSATGVVTVTPPAPDPPAVVEAQQATTDFQTSYQAAMTRLDQIIAANSPTNAQVVAAVQDLARFEKRLLRLAYARLGG